MTGAGKRRAGMRYGGMCFAAGPMAAASLALSAPVSAGGPVSLDVLYTAEIWSAARGAATSEARYLDNLDVIFGADLDKGLGWIGARAVVHGIYNNGASLTALSGDVQTISSIETGIEAVRLYEAYIEQSFGNASLKVGLQEINFDFDVLESANLFVQAAQGLGSDLALSSVSGPSTFPLTSFGARFEADLTEQITVRVAILDGVPGDLDNPKRTTVQLGGGDGALILAELETVIPNGKILLGHWRYTKAFDRFDSTIAGGNAGYYLRAERQLFGGGANSNGDLTGFVRLGISNAQTNAYNRFVGAGLVYTGALPKRPDDQFGIAVASAITSAPFRMQSGARGAETAIELTYRTQISKFFAIQPDIQYIFNPSASPTRANVLAVGLRGEIGVTF